MSTRRAQSLAGPKRPQDKVLLSRSTRSSSPTSPRNMATSRRARQARRRSTRRASHDLGHGDVVIAAITSCTNTSNPSVLVAAGLVARKARALGLEPQALGQDQPRAGHPGGHRLSRQGRPAARISNAIGFDLVGYGCTTCIGNSGPLPEPISKAIHEQRPGRRLGALRQPQFRGPRQPRRARQLSRLAAAGRRLCDQGHGDRGHGRHADRHRPATATTSICKDIWPTNDEIRSLIDQLSSTATCSARAMPTSTRATSAGRRSTSTGGDTYGWPAGSTYIANPPYFEGMTMTPTPPTDIVGARPLAILGDSHHHRPHQPGRRDQARQPGRQLSDRAPGRPRRLQLLRRPPRQPRSDDARHLRQHPHQEQDGPRRRGRHHQAHPDRRGRCRSTTRRCATRRTARRSSSSPARNMAPARRATGRPRAPTCSASAR